VLLFKAGDIEHVTKVMRYTDLCGRVVKEKESEEVLSQIE